jgi:hypothetical protein
VIKCLGKEFCNISDFVPNDGTLSRNLLLRRLLGLELSSSKRIRERTRRKMMIIPIKKQEVVRKGFLFIRTCPYTIICFLMAVHATLAFFAYCSCSLVILELVL